MRSSQEYYVVQSSPARLGKEASDFTSVGGKAGTGAASTAGKTLRKVKGKASELYI